MASKISTGGVIGTAVLALTCVAGLVGTAYSVTLAYIMGANAQAEVDGTAAADPRILLRSSAEQLIGKIREGSGKPIDIDDAKVKVNEADEATEAHTAEVI